MRKFYAGIDIGTYQVKAVIAAPAERPDLPMQILGTGSSSSRGLRHGYIIDKAEAAKSIKEALTRASAAAKIQVRTARLSVGGVGLDEVHSTGEISLTQSGGVVTDRDMDRALRESEKRASQKLVNRTVIHTIPLEYRLDGNTVMGRPQGLQGVKLTVEALLITMLTQHYDDLVEATEAAGVEVEGVMAAPLAASLVTLTKAQKTAGVCLANIGSETLSIVVFDNDTPVSLKVFPIGGSDITNSLALTFQVPLTEAEQMKRGAVTGSDVPQKKMEAIIVKRLKEMFMLINAHLKSLNRSKLLPAGVVITGGGSGLVSAQEIARAVLQLPSSIGQVGQLTRGTGIDAAWAVAYGLCRWAYGEDAEGEGGFGGAFGNMWDSIKQSIRSLLP
ncbi:MAG TPA: cell division protein FtsA [Candidatus Paceibacterota bacterium]|nr:cell division protein FtsA [Candidatus Paceibacterota bacterium]